MKNYSGTVNPQNTKAPLKISDEKLQKKIGFTPHEGQKQVIESTARDIVICAGRRWGKALDIKTPILTTKGWKTMKDVGVGDYVFGDDGKPARVTFATEVMHNHKCYKLTFSDGSEIIADAEHQWTVENKKFRKNRARAKNTASTLETKTTEELLKDYVSIRKDGRKESNYSIPTCGPLQYEEKSLKIPPYILGSWLGDGTSSNAGFTTADEEMIGLFEEYGYTLAKINSGKYEYKISRKEKRKKIRGGYTDIGIFMGELREYNLIENKHIPEIYKTAKYEQRLELLQGLMDTDGYCSVLGHCEYCGVNKKLVSDVYELILGLGIKAALYEYDCKLYGRIIGKKYRIKFSTDLQVFKLRRKIDNLFSKNRKQDTKRRFIKKIEEVKSVPVKCISVDNENKLYLAGKNLIATHNTLACSYLVTKEILQPNKTVFVIAPDYGLTGKVMDEVLKNLAHITNKYSYQKIPPKIILDNGSIVEGKSAENPRGILGSATDLNIIDEAAFLGDDIYHRYVKPTTLSKKGRTILISTPNGMNYFYELWLKAGRGQFHFTSYESPYVSAEELDKLKSVTPEKVFEQEYLAKFITSAGSAFGDLEVLIDGKMEEPEKNASYVIGVDLGMHNDFTAVVVIHVGKKKVVWAEKIREANWQFIKEKIFEISKKYNSAPLWVDSSGLGDAVFEDISRMTYAVPYSMHSAKAKEQLIDKLRIFCENRIIKLCDNKDLIEELRNYQYNIKSNGYVSYGAIKGQYDDLVIALALAVWALSPNIIEEEKAKIRKQFNEYD